METMKVGLLQSKELCYNSLNYFLKNIGKALNHRGIETQWIQEFNDEVLGQKWDALVGINNSLPMVKLEDGTFLLEFFNCPVFDILVDPPYYHHTILESHMDNLHIILLDKGHVEYCKTYYSSFQSVEMAWLLGPTDNCKKYEDKEIDILFAGSLVNENDIKRQAGEIYNEEWADAIFELLIENGKQHPNYTTQYVLEKVLEENDISYTDSELKVLMNNLGTYAEFYLRGYYRRKIVTTLVDAGLRVCIAGHGWDSLYPECPDNLVMKGCLDFEEMAELTANAKLVLNVMPWFKDGIHDRVLTAMMNGSVCITDSSSYIDEHFIDGEELIVFRLDDIESLPGQISALLESNEKAKQIAKHGYEKAIANYSWDVFVKEYILKWF